MLAFLQAKSAVPPFGYMALSEWYFEMLRDSARPGIASVRSDLNSSSFMSSHKIRHDLYERALQVEIAKVKAMHLPAILYQLAC